MSVLEELFNSKLELRLMKLFLRNPEDCFDIKTITLRSGAKGREVTKEVNKLHQIRFLSQKTDRKTKKKTYSLNRDFAFFPEIRELIFKEVPVDKERIVNKAKNLGKLKLLLVSGIFLNKDTCRTDMLLVTDGLSERKFATFLKELEIEVGKEINYSLMGIEEFYYRRKMYDKFLREVLKNPHEKIIDKLKM